MEHDHQSQEGHGSNQKFYVVLVVFAAVAGYFLIMEHRAHLQGALKYLPYLLLLACLLMHLFMHHGHDGHSSHTDKEGEKK